MDGKEFAMLYLEVTVVSEPETVLGLCSRYERRVPSDVHDGSNVSSFTPTHSFLSSTYRTLVLDIQS